MPATLTQTPDRRMTPNRRLAMALDPATILDVIGYDEVPGGGPATADEWQKTILRSTARRMLVNCHRQAGKSTAVSGLAVHTALYDAPALILIVSSGLRASGEMFRKITAAYERLGRPVATLEDNSITLALANGSRIVSLPNNADSIRSYSAPKLVIADEASRIDEPVFAAIRPMLGVSQGRIILMSTPHGRRGEFYRMWASGDPAWSRIELKGEDNPRISREYLEQEKRDMIPWEFRQEWCCAFEDTQDQIISGEVITQAFSSTEAPFFSDEDLYG
jgi:hypothetical protein